MKKQDFIAQFLLNNCDIKGCTSVEKAKAVMNGYADIASDIFDHFSKKEEP